jgi:glyoxylase-like metal-dependent hydrolase (beta-lactamase superfamily II)/ferredoxin
VADPKRAHPSNVPGDLFVDTTCIDCPICREAAPGIFGDAPDQAIVVRQPSTDEERLRAGVALVSCPAGSIGSRSKMDVAPAIELLPERIAGEVYACGFASKESYGAQSYFIRRAEGNVLVDSPRFAGPLVQKLEKLGGIRYVYLTHQDDVADHERFHRAFGAERVLHESEARGSLASVERKLEGEGPWFLAPDLKILAVPGHTVGHTALLHRDEFLFTGDHMYADDGRLTASRRYNWHSWEEQLHSIEKLLGESFTWVLPGHGSRFHASRETMREELRATLERLRMPSRRQ